MQEEDEWLDLLPGIDSEETENSILRHLEQNKSLPEVFFCGNDLLAVTLAKVLRRAGVRVPEDISLIGVDIGCSRQVEAAVEQLASFIETGTYKPARILMPTTLRWGDSVAYKKAH